MRRSPQRGIARRTARARRPERAPVRARQPFRRTHAVIVTRHRKRRPQPGPLSRAPRRAGRARRRAGLAALAPRHRRRPAGARLARRRGRRRGRRATALVRRRAAARSPTRTARCASSTAGSKRSAGPSWPPTRASRSSSSSSPRRRASRSRPRCPRRVRTPPPAGLGLAPDGAAQPSAEVKRVAATWAAMEPEKAAALDRRACPTTRSPPVLAQMDPDSRGRHHERAAARPPPPGSAGPALRSRRPRADRAK